LTAALATKVIGTLLAAYGFGLITPICGSEIALIYGYSIVWAFLTNSTEPAASNRCTAITIH